MSNRYGLASMPAAQYARKGRNNVPHRRTVAEMRRHAEARELQQDYSSVEFNGVTFWYR